MASNEAAAETEEINRRLATVSESVRAPFGNWPMDKYHEDVSQSVRSSGPSFSNRFFCVVIGLEKDYVVKMFYNPYHIKLEDWMTDAWFTSKFDYELKLMMLAEESSIPPIGRVFDNAGNLRGFIMPRETSLVPPRPQFEERIFPWDSHSPASRKKIIYQLCALVTLLHSKGVIHGDIKPANLLQCSDGELRFCDFELGGVIGRNPQTRGGSEVYCSPSRNHPETWHFPLSIADDFYATGVSIWEIYTGCIPFGDVPNPTYLENIIAAGVRPDLLKIDDPEILGLVLSYLDRGCSRSGTIRQTDEVCINTTVGFKDCLANPPHTYDHLVQCVACSVKPPPEGFCPNLYRAPGMSNSTEGRSCTLCPESTA